MKKRLAAIIVAMVSVISFSACGSVTVKEDSSAQNTAEIENKVITEISTEVVTDAQTTAVQEETTFNAVDAMRKIVDIPYIDLEDIPASFIMNIYSDPDASEKGIGELTYNGGDIVLYFDTSVSEEYRRYGLFFMIDGIRQPIRVEENGVVTEETQMYVCDINEGDSAQLKIYITPNTGLKGETVYLTYALYAFPSYITADKMHTAFAEGYNSDSISSSYPVTVYMNTDSTNSEKVNAETSNVTVGEYASVINKQIVSSEIEKKLGLRSSVGGTTIFPEGVFYKNIDDNIFMDFGSLVYDRSIVIDGTKNEKISLALFEQISDYTGDFYGEYRVSLYVDHELMPVFEGCNYADISVEKGKQTTLEFELDTSELPEYSRCYLILAKLDSDAREIHKIDCILEKNG